MFFWLFYFATIFYRENSIDDYCHSNNHSVYGETSCVHVLLLFQLCFIYNSVTEKIKDGIPTETSLGVSTQNKSLRHLKLDTSMN